jgi:hypothetical protein
VRDLDRQRRQLVLRRQRVREADAGAARHRVGAGAERGRLEAREHLGDQLGVERDARLEADDRVDDLERVPRDWVGRALLVFVLMSAVPGTNCVGATNVPGVTSVAKPIVSRDWTGIGVS